LGELHGLRGKRGRRRGGPRIIAEKREKKRGSADYADYRGGRLRGVLFEKLFLFSAIIRVICGPLLIFFREIRGQKVISADAFRLLLFYAPVAVSQN